MLDSFDHHHTHGIQPHLLPGEATDEELMLAIQARNESALMVLYHRHAPLLRAIASRVVNNDTDADDLLQEVFCEVWRLADHYAEDKGKALGWLVTLARRRAIDKLRKKKAYQRAEDRLRDDTQEGPINTTHHGADEEAIASDRAEILQRVIATLPEAQRDALNLAFYRGMSQREIAAHTGIPLGTIKTRLELAMRKVRSAVLALGGTGEWSQSHN
jgi:RNA polymerase sigma-70 factor (ECF subfamily)